MSGPGMCVLRTDCFVFARGGLDASWYYNLLNLCKGLDVSGYKGTCYESHTVLILHMTRPCRPCHVSHSAACLPVV